MPYVSISIPRQCVTAETLGLLEEVFSEARSVFDQELDILTLSGMDIALNKLDRIEWFLIEEGIPFNRHSADPEKDRKFRPGIDNEESIIVELNYIGGRTVIGVDDVRQILALQNDPYDIIQTLKEELNKIDPEISSLQEWADATTSMTTTTEIDLDRFSDIF